MGSTKIVAIVLIAAGILALVYGGFTYTQETHDVSLGSLEISVQDKRRINVPIWAGVLSIALGGGLLLFGGGKR